MADSPLVLGIDIGTSGVRAIAIDADGRIHGEGSAGMAGESARAPETWALAADNAIAAALAEGRASRVRAIAFDGTSGTMLALDGALHPAGPALMYNDICTDGTILERIATEAPRESAAHGATSALARAIILAGRHPDHILVHQADWLAARLTGQVRTDENNALKTGYDPVARTWPGWIAATGIDPSRLPAVLPAGAFAGTVTAHTAVRFNLRHDTAIIAGTTDGCAAFLATGACKTGDGVTSLGSTLTLKILSEHPVFSPAHGIYSHRLLELWLPGGASNTGGAALAAHFDAAAIDALSARIDADSDCGLDYYPLRAAGERFPVADPWLAPRVTPRPADDALFLHGLLDGIARIEAEGYAALALLGTPSLRSVRTVGGGAANATWTRLRQRRLGVPMLAATSTQAAYGTALLALHGARTAGVLP